MRVEPNGKRGSSHPISDTSPDRYENDETKAKNKN